MRFCILCLSVVLLSSYAEGSTTLANSRVSLAFDEKIGALVSLKNLATGDEYLKGAFEGGNLFRAYALSGYYFIEAKDPARRSRLHSLPLWRALRVIGK